MTEPRFTAFDIEITKSFPPSGDWQSVRPLGISCAATLDSTGALRLWHGPEGPDGRFASQMTPENCRELARALIQQRAEGLEVVTWNGLGFDFDILVEECGPFPERQRLVEMALGHTDMAFAMLCDRGFMVGLDTAAKGMGLAGKTPGMRAELLPLKWAQGRQEQDQVLTYVAQDVRTTAALFRAILRSGRLNWTSRRRKPAEWPLPGGTIPTVMQALALPEPDTRWMSDPWPRSRFYAWTGWRPGSV